jgi:predicted P-loop ATPase
MEEEKDYLAETEKKVSWKDKLQKDVFTVKGVTVEKIKKCPDNIIVFLENHPKYAGKLKYNEYLRMKEFDGREFSDFDLSIINNDVFRELGFSNKGWTEDSINEVFNKNRYNPVLKYIKSLKWDGKKRIDKLFINLLDADDTELNRTMTRKWMLAAVKRTFIPGCKFDNMIVLQGSQGIGKYTICERLAKGFFSTISLDEIENKDIIDKMNKTWIGIIDEMDNFNRKEMSKVKTFLSQVKDTVRLAYARNTTTFDRHCIFIGSTNDDTFLRDSTSSVERRFWIIKCNKTKMDNKIRKVMTDEYVDQLWAEAVQSLKDNPNQYLDIDQGMMEEFAKTQEQYKTYNDDDMVEYIKDVLDKPYRIGIDGEVTDISQLDDFSAGEKNYINKIKGYVLTELLTRKFHSTRGTKYLELALGGEWKYKNVKYKGNKQSWTWVRVNPRDNSTGKQYDPMEEFTVGLKI